MEISETGVLRVTSVGGPRKRRQSSTGQLTVDISIEPNQRVITIPRANLEEGSTYVVQVNL